jgi:hypothetical protein
MPVKRSARQESCRALFHPSHFPSPITGTELSEAHLFYAALSKFDCGRHFHGREGKAKKDKKCLENASQKVYVFFHMTASG